MHTFWRGHLILWGGAFWAIFCMSLDNWLATIILSLVASTMIDVTAIKPTTHREGE